MGTDFEYGIVSGTSATTFNPNGTITRQEAAKMIANAAVLCGLNVQYDDVAVRNVLAQFDDYTKASDWAKSSLAFVYDNEIFDSSEISINPNAKITRAEIAQCVYNLLKCSKLL